jgi:hypothetical protein
MVEEFERDGVQSLGLLLLLNGFRIVVNWPFASREQSVGNRAQAPRVDFYPLYA